MMTAWGKRQKDTRDARADSNAKQKANWNKARKAEEQYTVRLRKLARHVGDIVNTFKTYDPDTVGQINRLLRDYAKLITPWAGAVANSMLADVAYRDKEAWAKMTQGMSLALRRELAAAPTGTVLRQLQAEQIKYITKIPLDAAQRVHDLSMDALLTSRRAEDVAKEIRRQGEVSKAYADLVARTEVGRAASNLTQARATHIGSEQYIWRTADDSDVRPSHKALEGSVQRWDRPPLCDAPNYHAHPGAIFNCRCYAEVIIPDRYK